MKIPQFATSLFKRASAPALAGVVCAALLTGCATGPKLDYTDYAGEPVKSFYMNNFDGWTVISKDQVVIWSGMNKAYLLTLTGYCPDLQHVNAIAVTSTGNTVDRFEKVIVGKDRCFINEIRPLDTKQMKEDRKLMREQMKKPQEALPEPEPAPPEPKSESKT
jgi:hypothetical protein